MSTLGPAISPEVVAVVVFLVTWIRSELLARAEKVSLMPRPRERLLLPRRPCAAELHVEGEEGAVSVEQFLLKCKGKCCSHHWPRDFQLLWAQFNVQPRMLGAHCYNLQFIEQTKSKQASRT